MSDRKLYALTDQDVAILKEVLAGQLIGATFTGGPRVPVVSHAAEALTPLEVPGYAAEQLMRTHSSHMSVGASGSGWVCFECGHAYDGRINETEVWAHAFACVLVALTTRRTSHDDVGADDHV